jgi:hypothetical protein
MEDTPVCMHALQQHATGKISELAQVFLCKTGEGRSPRPSPPGLRLAECAPGRPWLWPAGSWQADAAPNNKELGESQG